MAGQYSMPHKYHLALSFWWQHGGQSGQLDREVTVGHHRGGGEELIVTGNIRLCWQTSNNILLKIVTQIWKLDSPSNIVHSEKKQVLVEAFWIYHNCKSCGTPGANQNFKITFWFLFSHEPEHQWNLAPPIGNKNSQKIASWHMTYIQWDRKNTKRKGLEGCKNRHKANPCRLPNIFFLALLKVCQILCFGESQAFQPAKHFFQVSCLLISTACREGAVGRRAKLVGWLVGWIVEEMMAAYTATRPPKFQHAGCPGWSIQRQRGVFPVPPGPRGGCSEAQGGEGATGQGWLSLQGRAPLFVGKEEVLGTMAATMSLCWQ